jgi:hypothetical protein
MHQGKIWGRNNDEGQGATFSFELPLINWISIFFYCCRSLSYLHRITPGVLTARQWSNDDLFYITWLSVTISIASSTLFFRCISYFSIWAWKLKFFYDTMIYSQIETGHSD